MIYTVDSGFIKEDDTKIVKDLIEQLQIMGCIVIENK